MHSIFTEKEWNSWLSQPETKEYFNLLLKEKEQVLDHALNLSSSGDDLTRDYYQLQGIASGIVSAYRFAELLAQEGANVS